MISRSLLLMLALTGMAGHLVLPCSHPFLPRDRTAIRQTIHFLGHGRFQDAAP